MSNTVKKVIVLLVLINTIICSYLLWIHLPPFVLNRDPKTLPVIEKEFTEGICTIKYPQIENYPNKEVQGKINMTIMNHVDNSIVVGKRTNQQNQSVTPGTAPYQYKLSYKIHVNDGKILSLTFNDFMFTGGAHGMYSIKGMTFNVKTGDVLTWESLYGPVDNARRTEIGNLIIAQSSAKNTRLYSPFKWNILDQPFNFYLNENKNPAIMFQPYVLGPYSSGVIELEITDKKLLDKKQ